MRQRITFIHKPEDAIDPKSIEVASDSLAVSGLKAAREDRITFGFGELPQEIYYVLKQSHELHVRHVSNVLYEPIPPLISKLSPGLHVYYTPQRSASNSDLLCPLINKIIYPISEQLCQSPEKSFTSLPTHRFHHSTAYEYYLPQSHYNKHAIVDYMLQTCPTSNQSCRRRVERLREAAYIDLDFDTISHTLTISSFWTSQIWDFSISNEGSNDRLEVGILSNEKPLELEELNLAGFLTVVGEDSKPSPTLFAFPARHHPSSSYFSATFLKPTGLHPSLQLQISSPTPPSESQTCALHAHLSLPRVIFADKYQLSDALFLSSKNLAAVRHITSPVDLEAPEYTMSLWGSSLLLELAPPSLDQYSSSSSSSRPKSAAAAAQQRQTQEEETWTAEIPLHLRYLAPTTSGYSRVSIPWPVLFWACVANEGTKFTINPFDRANLGYDGLFGPRTMFYHLSPRRHPGLDANTDVDGSGNWTTTEGYSTLDVPVLKLGVVTDWVEVGTAVVVALGFSWLMWKLWRVWRVEGYGRGGDGRDEGVLGAGVVEEEEKKKTK